MTYTYNKDIHEKCQEMYLEFVNDFLTLEAFASYHGLGLPFAMQIIEHGKFYHETTLRHKIA